MRENHFIKVSPKEKPLSPLRLLFISFTFEGKMHSYESHFAENVSYRAVLSKCEIFIKMRVAESRPSFDIDKSCFSKKACFTVKITSYFITLGYKSRFLLTFRILLILHATLSFQICWPLNF